MDSDIYNPLTTGNIHCLSPSSTEITSVDLDLDLDLGPERRLFERLQHSLTFCLKDLATSYGQRGRDYVKQSDVYIKNDTLHWRGAPALQSTLCDAQALLERAQQCRHVMEAIKPPPAYYIDVEGQREKNKRDQQQKLRRQRMETIAAWAENTSPRAALGDEDKHEVSSTAVIQKPRLKLKTRVEMRRSAQSKMKTICGGIQKSEPRRSARIQPQGGPRRSARIRDQALACKNKP
ncbi:hypothetical protein ED733_000208 [Metarhizium rileyi]|uniref:Uncharacterized protein n=1 Tax=Metarhizium rileyi (strain RCEF 4871) TaxID=1649241 RepID=A0A5C6GC01_METRR|nr:hypothetical protein ED733_000208 [Metarhizium rileyi]